MEESTGSPRSSNGGDGRTPAEGRGVVGWMVRGLVAGAMGTAAMSGLLRALQAGRVFGAEPPREITRSAVACVGPGRRGKMPGGVEGPLSVLAHAGFGLSNGLVYAALRPALVRHAGRVPSRALGVGYGLVVWLISYQGWLPALNLFPAASADDRGRQEALVAGHAVYGYVVDRMISA